MKSVNYYMRDERNHPFAAITVIENEGFVARGISICNPNDQFIKTEGRELSALRAVKALRKEKTYGPIRRIDLGSSLKAKCEFMPELTEYEIELLRDPKSV
jgi:hypothetical protein